MLSKESNAALLDMLGKFFAGRQEVLFAWLFGSYASGRNNGYSDIDIAIYIKDQILLDDSDWYLGLKLGIMDLTHKEVDLIVLNSAKPLVKHAANMKKIVLLSRDPQFEAEYSLRIIKEYNDARYWARRSRQYLLGGE
jgi:predicted nucleotidyltransferase